MSSIENKHMLMKNKLSKKSLLGNWHTEDIDSERLKFSQLVVGQKNVGNHNLSIVVISRWKEVANHTFKIYEQSCKQTGAFLRSRNMEKKSICQLLLMKMF